MKKIILLLILVCLSSFVFAEEKSTFGIVPKLTAEEMQDGPTLMGNVYPSLGVPCMNFTYYAQYRDEKDREPEYVRLWLNNQWHDLTLLEGTPQSGATYVYNYVPTSGKGNFYYYEASNGVGKTRASIIDSPDNGPVLFSEKLDNNEIVLLDKKGKEIWNYLLGKEWTEGVALSKDGNYIAVVTGFHIYLFSKESNVPLWNFCVNCNPSSTMTGNMEGVAISQDGNYVAGTMQAKLYFFAKGSNQPLWTADIESGSEGIDMADDASVIAVSVSNAGKTGDTIFLFDKSGNKLSEYKAPHPGYDQTGNFYQPDVTPDGKYVAVSTGCPDRRAHLFSGTGNLIFRSEQLTYDSPVHKSAISDDGSLMAYSADNMQGKEILFLFDNKGKKLWSFSSSEDGTARAVSMSGDGNYIAIGTSAGHVYLFSKDSNKPKWKFTSSTFFSQFGDLKLNHDGSLLTVGGTTKKIYLFSKNSNVPVWEYAANTWVTKIDFNGEYIVAGTGPREYFFEGNSIPPDEIQCKEIIQPEPLMNYLGKSIGNLNIVGAKSVCGDSICVTPQETSETCPIDCSEQNFNDEPDLNVEESDKKQICSNGICEASENCPEDCRGSEDSISDINEEKSLFEKIMDWFRGLFR
ncbi:MAG: PQQ-binding-like beta-propeller repeat protein [Nanoarchaeota archaeon]